VYFHCILLEASASILRQLSPECEFSEPPNVIRALEKKPAKVAALDGTFPLLPVHDNPFAADQSLLGAFGLEGRSLFVCVHSACQVVYIR
jgi:hypothetical protein